MGVTASEYAASGAEVPAGKAIEITPADTDLADFTRAIYVGTAGDLAVIMAEESVGGGTTVVTFKAVGAGSILPIRVAQIRSTGTTASDIIALS